MNSLSKKLSIVILSAMVAFAGCSKKPKRPAPSDTVLGTQAGAGAGGLNAGGPENLGADAGLPQRGPDDVIDDGKTIRNLLKPVYFKYNDSAIESAEREKLQAAKDYLEKNPQYRLLFEGHCDWRGTAEYNLGLGDRRANAAKKYISTLGVPAAKTETVSKGDLDAPENASEEQMQKDRRVDIVVLKQ